MTENLDHARQFLAKSGVDAFICPLTDRFLSRGRLLRTSDNLVAWLTGLPDRLSSGTVIFTRDACGFFTDSRYEDMAKTELDQKVFSIFIDNDKTMVAWAATQIGAGKVLGYDPALLSIDDVTNLATRAQDADITIKPVAHNPVLLAKGSAATPHNAAVVAHAPQFSGTPSVEKFGAVCENLRLLKCDHYLITNPGSLAWVLNVRVPDHGQYPALGAFGLINVASQQLTLFTDHPMAGLLPEFARAVPLRDTAQIANNIGQNPIGLDVRTTPALFADLQTTPLEDPCVLLKARKNATELSGIVASHVRDGVALCKTLAWIDRNIGQITEWDVAKKLLAMRSAAENFRNVSFDPIVGFNAHGASIHHATRRDNAQKITGNGLLLIDSGGQYDDGTTDVTRTLGIGTPTTEMQTALTHVLRAHIALANATFPEGATGSQLDGIARAPLWAVGMEYKHGTGHGVGHWSNVHEGPYGFSSRCNDGLVPDVLLSIEPGFYKTGAFGIRLENLVITRPTHTPHNLSKPQLELHTVTLAPFDTRCLLPTLLNTTERAWLNAYHARVRAEIGPHLTGDDKAWLLNATKDIV